MQKVLADDYRDSVASVTFHVEGMLNASSSVMFCTAKSLKMNQGSGSDTSASGTATAVHQYTQ